MERLSVPESDDREPAPGSLEWLRRRTEARPGVDIKSVDLLRDLYNDDD